METIYIYLLDTMADWELSFVMPAINQAANFNKGQQRYQLKTVGATAEPIKTGGGLTITPDMAVADMTTGVGLILPGADTWSNAKHQPILALAKKYLAEDKLVAAICGATLGLANQGLLDNRQHTSSSLTFLTGFSQTYQGSANYQARLAVRDGMLITASPAGYLDFAREIFVSLNLFPATMIEAWYNYYKTGEEAYFFELMALSAEGE